MPVVDVVNLDGKKVGQVELADAADINSELEVRLRKLETTRAGEDEP